MFPTIEIFNPYSICSKIHLQINLKIPYDSFRADLRVPEFKELVKLFRFHVYILILFLL